MKDWRSVVEDSGYSFVGQTEVDLIFNLGEFEFKINKYKFPPKKISIRQCLTPREYCISRFKGVHGYYYTYDNFEWCGKVSDYGIMTCPIHGDFKQIINNHLRGQGCFKCFGSEKLTLDVVRNRCIESRGDEYDYSQLSYDHSSNNIKIRCKKHGIFETNLYHHLKGVNCSNCALDNRSGSYISSDEFKVKAESVHLDRYCYQFVEYKGAKTGVRIVCKIHGEFTQKPNDHLNGNGCPSCGHERSGFTRSAYVKACGEGGSNLYVMKIYGNSETFYKIGISKDVKSRVRGIVCESGYSVDVVFTYPNSATVIFDLEIYLHRKFKDFKYRPKISFSGCTECFVNITENCVEKEILNCYN